MHISEAIALARSEINSHPELAGWKVEIFNRKNTLGLCNYSRRTISLSRSFVTLNSREIVHQTILHEIAHALLPPDVKHGARWLKLARSLGYTGSRTVSSGDIEVDYLWIGRCPNNHDVVGYHRRPRRPASCGECSPTYNAAYPVVYTNTRTGEIFKPEG